VRLGPHDWAVRCNLVHVDREEMRDFTAGHVTSAHGRALIEAVGQALGGPVPAGLPGHGDGRLEFYPGVSYRNLLVYRGGGPGPFTAATTTQAPHDVPDRPVADHLPSGPGAELLRHLMRASRDVLRDHPVNRERAAAGQKTATQVWLWGQGRAPSLRPFAEAYGPRGAIVSAVDLVRGVGVLLGWTRVDVPGATGYLDTDYAAKGRYGALALGEHDLVCVHVEAPDEASHEGRADAKVRALEEIDRHIVGPLLEALPRYGAWRLLVSPDHRTTLRTRAHAHGAVPFAVAGDGVAPRGQASYDEAAAADSPLAFERGHELMPRFLTGRP
jgi:2,3-bisphosphoglycerate-independent phosphoglycerate mutase